MSSLGNDKLIKEATDLLDSSAVMPSYASNLISRLQVALSTEQTRAAERVSRVQYEEACRLLRERTGQLSDMEERANRAQARLAEVETELEEIQDEQERELAAYREEQS